MVIEEESFVFPLEMDFALSLKKLLYNPKLVEVKISNYLYALNYLVPASLYFSSHYVKISTCILVLALSFMMAACCSLSAF